MGGFYELRLFLYRNGIKLTEVRHRDVLTKSYCNKGYRDTVVVQDYYFQ